MDKKVLNNSIAKCLCGEFEQVWIIDIDTMLMASYTVDDNETLVQIEENDFRPYDAEREAYADEYVVDNDKNRFLEMTAIDKVLDSVYKGMPYDLEYCRIKNDEVIYSQLFFSKTEAFDGDSRYILAGFRDMGAKKLLERDELTGLYTRQAFFKRAEKLLKDKPDTVFDIMISDIVDFKAVNEIYGPSVGDSILKWIGSFLGPFISEDFLVGRYGGDQNVILATHDMIAYISSPEGIANFKYARENNGLPYIDIKFGIYENIGHDKSIMSICDRAHIALNSIKHQYGKILAYYDEKLRREREMVRKIEGSMHEALEQKQFKVYYQPKHDAATGKLVGAEALIRWVHPEYGFMSPGEFIPVFERNGFVVETDSYVWDRTCENLRRWKDKGINVVPISVNASKLTFRHADLLRRLQVAVEEYHISPSLLHIEITETMMTEDVEGLVRKLNAIRSIGYQIELDDFGAGYSSINVLSTLPLDIVKLDMSFMKQFGDEKRSKVLVACINLAKQLGYKTVSEGVEQKEQYDLLGILGVDYIQGYYFSKPLSEEDFEEYMLKNMS